VAAHKGAPRAQARGGSVRPADGRHPEIGDAGLLTQSGGNDFWPRRRRAGDRADPRKRQRVSAVASPGSLSAENADTSCLSDTGRPFRETGCGDRGCSGWHAVKRAAHPGSETPATAIWHRGGRPRGGARAHAQVQERGGSPRTSRRKPCAWELETWRILVTTSRLQKLVRSICSGRSRGLEPEERSD
jgi:hypothetical protein